MKIAILRQRVSGLGGAETTVGHLMRGLVAAGHEVAILSTDPPQDAQMALGPGVRQIRVPVWGNKTGRLLSFAFNARRLVKQSGVHLVFSLERTLFHATGSYYIPNVRATGACCRTNLPSNTAFRGFGGPQAMFVIEAALAKLAATLGVEREELQEKNLLSEGDVLPYGQRERGAQARRSFPRLLRTMDTA